ncbi:MAG TPA: glycosyltransferase family 39 protein [Phycisphaerae bacterium]|nr:glycosyltransferase family 39 protein [Phycisphaerae bacterium]
MGPPRGDMPAEIRTGRRWWREGAPLLVAMVVLVAFRLHAFDLPLETDECNYIYTGARLLEGDRLYVDVWDHQPPGVFWLFAGVISVFGDQPEVFRRLVTVVSVVVLGLIWVVVRRTVGAGAAALAALLFAICNADPGMAGEGCNREIFMNAFAVGALGLLVRGRHPGRRDLLLAGLLLGLGSTIKTVMAAQWALLAVWVLVSAWQSAGHGQRIARAAGAVALFAAGPAAVWVAVFGYFALAGRLGPFYEAAFTFNLVYSDVAASYWQRFVDFFRAPVHQYVFTSTWPLWIAAGSAAVALAVSRRGKRSGEAGGAVVCYLVGSYLAVCLPGQFWPHYYYLMLPPLVIVLGTGIGHFASPPRSARSARLGRWIALGVAGLVIASMLVMQTRHYLLVPTLRITDQRYDSRDLWGRAQGENVARVTEPADTILVYAQDVGVYYYSGRRAATRYTMVRALEEQYPGYENRRALLLEEVKANRPRLALMIDEPFPALYEYLMAHYEVTGVDYHDRRTDEPIMFVLADKTRPVEKIDWNWHRSSVLPE